MCQRHLKSGEAAQLIYLILIQQVAAPAPLIGTARYLLLEKYFMFEDFLEKQWQTIA